MDTLQTTFTVLGIVATVLGVVGGLLSLPSTYEKYRRERQPHGSKGVGILNLNRTETDDAIIVRFLIVGDLFQCLTNMAQEKSSGVITDVQAIGDYYIATIEYPPGTDLTFRIVNRNKRSRFKNRGD